MKIDLNNIHNHLWVWYCEDKSLSLDDIRVLYDCMAIVNYCKKNNIEIEISGKGRP